MQVIRTLLEHAVDYAGLFPPANLALADALQTYASLVVSPRDWLLGRFVCPAARLQELRDRLETVGRPDSSCVAALGRGGTEVRTLRLNVDLDLSDIARFRQWRGDVGAVGVYELLMPDSPPATLADSVLEATVSAGLHTFFELRPSEVWRDTVGQTARRLRESQFATQAGLKIRCGGAGVPAAEDVAFFIARCRDARIAWKATAGLHHALAQTDAAGNVVRHGFLNVFVADALARTHALDERTLTELLRESSIEQFRVSEYRIGWRTWDCDAATVRNVRCVGLAAFGSCSFDEPWNDLRTAGWVA